MLECNYRKLSHYKKPSSKRKCPGIIVSAVALPRFHRSIPDNFPITTVTTPDEAQFTKSRQKVASGSNFKGIGEIEVINERNLLIT